MILFSAGYWLDRAKQVSKYGNCLRKQVGAVIVKNNDLLIAVGWNQGIEPLKSCILDGCVMENGHCTSTLHAEAYAIANACDSTVGAILYSTVSPCWDCFKLIYRAGISRVVFSEIYLDQRSFDTAKRLGVGMVHIP